MDRLRKLTDVFIVKLRKMKIEARIFEEECFLLTIVKKENYELTIFIRVNPDEFCIEEEAEIFREYDFEDINLAKKKMVELIKQARMDNKI